MLRVIRENHRSILAIAHFILLAYLTSFEKAKEKLLEENLTCLSTMEVRK